MSLHLMHGHPTRGHEHGGHGDYQVAVVAGYSWTSPYEACVYLACGTLPSGLLRYAGKTAITFESAAERRAFALQLHPMRLQRRHPLMASPLPADMVSIAPKLLAEVSHHGWTPGGLMNGISIERFRSADEAEPEPAASDGPFLMLEP